ncbi:hypothetical protein NEIRO03_0611 [Nematocida sp. AWRm78]|nr:hypothetical protein NEIRO02_0524 [Nematocida sp. AWRm79]KAI5182976.1 hypothetical protein NEIRO03_0611 [Nematocida sp. AWRm78]
MNYNQHNQDDFEDILKNLVPYDEAEQQERNETEDEELEIFDMDAFENDLSEDLTHDNFFITKPTKEEREREKKEKENKEREKKEKEQKEREEKEEEERKQKKREDSVSIQSINEMQSGSEDTQQTDRTEGEFKFTPEDTFNAEYSPEDINPETESPSLQNTPVSSSTLELTPELDNQEFDGMRRVPDNSHENVAEQSAQSSSESSTLELTPELAEQEFEYSPDESQRAEEYMDMPEKTEYPLEKEVPEEEYNGNYMPKTVPQEEAVMPNTQPEYIPDTNSPIKHMNNSPWYTPEQNVQDEPVPNTSNPKGSVFKPIPDVFNAPQDNSWTLDEYFQTSPESSSNNEDAFYQNNDQEIFGMDESNSGCNVSSTDNSYTQDAYVYNPESIPVENKEEESPATGSEESSSLDELFKDCPPIDPNTFKYVPDYQQSTGFDYTNTEPIPEDYSEIPQNAYVYDQPVEESAPAVNSSANTIVYSPQEYTHNNAKPSAQKQAFIPTSPFQHSQPSQVPAHNDLQHAHVLPSVKDTPVSLNTVEEHGHALEIPGDKEASDMYSHPTAHIQMTFCGDKFIIFSATPSVTNPHKLLPNPVKTVELSGEIKTDNVKQKSTQELVNSLIQTYPMNYSSSDHPLNYLISKSIDTFSKRSTKRIPSTPIKEYIPEVSQDINSAMLQNNWAEAFFLSSQNAEYLLCVQDKYAKHTTETVTDYISVLLSTQCNIPPRLICQPDVLDNYLTILAMGIKYKNDKALEELISALFKNNRTDAGIISIIIPGMIDGFTDKIFDINTLLIIGKLKEKEDAVRVRVKELLRRVKVINKKRAQEIYKENKDIFNRTDKKEIEEFLCIESSSWGLQGIINAVDKGITRMVSTPNTAQPTPASTPQTNSFEVNKPQPVQSAPFPAQPTISLGQGVTSPVGKSTFVKKRIAHMNRPTFPLNKPVPEAQSVRSESQVPPAQNVSTSHSSTLPLGSTAIPMPSMPTSSETAQKAMPIPGIPMPSMPLSAPQQPNNSAMPEIPQDMPKPAPSMPFAPKASGIPMPSIPSTAQPSSIPTKPAPSMPMPVIPQGMSRPAPSMPMPSIPADTQASTTAKPAPSMPMPAATQSSSIPTKPAPSMPAAAEPSPIMPYKPAPKVEEKPEEDIDYKKLYSDKSRYQIIDSTPEKSSWLGYIPGVNALSGIVKKLAGQNNIPVIELSQDTTFVLDKKLNKWITVDAKTLKPIKICASKASDEAASNSVSAPMPMPVLTGKIPKRGPDGKVDFGPVGTSLEARYGKPMIQSSIDTTIQDTAPAFPTSQNMYSRKNAKVFVPKLPIEDTNTQ